MKALLFALPLLLAAQLATGQARPSTSLKLPAADEQAIRATVQQKLDNYQDHKFQNMAAYTTPEVSWVNIVGMHWQGRAQVQQAHQAVFDAIFRGVAFTPHELMIQPVTADVAVVRLRCDVGAFYPPDGVNRGGNKQGDNQNLLMLVLVKRQGKWLLTAGQNTEVNAAATANDPAKGAAK